MYVVYVLGMRAWGGVRGLYCTATSGSVVALSQAMEECHGAEEGLVLRECQCLWRLQERCQTTPSPRL